MPKTKNRKYSDVGEKIEAYFASCDEENSAGGGKIRKPYTLTGLISYIGVTRAEFERLAAKRQYAPLISDAFSKIEAFIEEHALTGDLAANAAANSLKYNFGWGDRKQDSTAGGNIKIVLDGESSRLAD